MTTMHLIVRMYVPLLAPLQYCSSQDMDIPSRESLARLAGHTRRWPAMRLSALMFLGSNPGGHWWGLQWLRQPTAASRSSDTHTLLSCPRQPGIETSARWTFVELKL